MNRDKARNWQARPFEPHWLDALTLQMNGSLKTYLLWLKGNIPVMPPAERKRAKLMVTAIVLEQKRRKDVRRARLDERSAARKARKAACA